MNRITRRRLITVAAAAAVLPGRRGHADAVEAVWRGRALGAEATIKLIGAPDRAEGAIAAAQRTLASVEAQFSLYRASSALSRLNRTSRLIGPDASFLSLMASCGRVHDLTDGRFDPTLQPVWALLAEHRGRPDPAALETARRRVGWQRVAVTAQAVHLTGPGMALTLNGIAQGYATDRVAAVLAAHGFEAVLVDIGELKGAGRPWRVGIADPVAGLIEERRLDGRAIATSSPASLAFGQGGIGHILDPSGRTEPRWRTVSVEADSATLADGLSTAMCLMAPTAIRAAMAAEPTIRRVVAVGSDGAVNRFG
ncbi:MAG: FAD:protein FMN transferase [Pseudomonadota bacterium]